MSYHLLAYFAVFLPAVIIIYQLVPQKYRFIVLLAADYIFFWLISGKLLIYLLCSTLLTHYSGIWMEHVDLKGDYDKKAAAKIKKRILIFAVLVSLGVLLVLKYTNFFGVSISNLLHHFGVKWDYRIIRFAVPIGISFYTLQIISYLTDVYRGTIKAENNLAKIALYLSFFPQIMEGPIARYSETAESLYSGNGIKFNNLKFGYQRIIWGLFKKIVIADRIYPLVNNVFNNYETMDGSMILVGAVCYTAQLYMEFSGSMDVIIGSGEIFGVTLPENFRQPFLAKDASEFWRRWHITLGTFFKDYIFYPVSLSKPVKNFAKKIKKVFGRGASTFVAPIAALFCVWISNGLWHGAKWTYIFYGVYYFVLILIETMIAEPVNKLCAKLHIKRESVPYRIFQTIKLFIIVVSGELFFRANSLSDGFAMFGKIFSDFHVSVFMAYVNRMGMDYYDIIVVVIGVIVVTVVGALKEKGINIRDGISNWKIVPRWAIWYLAIVAIIVLGAYGSGYDVVDLIYAGY